VRVDDLKQHVKLFLLDMSERNARLRAGVLLPPQTGVSFRWVGPSREAIVVHGHVCDIRMADKRTAEYAVEFSMPAQTLDHLARELQRLQRRKLPKPALAAAPAESENAGGEDLAEFESAKDRKAYRAMVQFPVGARVLRKGKMVALEAEARDLSLGGMLLLLEEDVDEGTELELSFSLPADADQAENVKEIVEMTPFGERRIKKSSPKRRVEQLFVKARVLKKAGHARNGSPLFGVEFVEVPGFLTDEIARWIHAHQLKQLRRGSAARKTAVRPPVRAHVKADAPNAKAMRAMFTPHASERRFTFAAYAKNREIVRLPQHKAAPVVTRGTDVFGLGNVECASAPAAQRAVRETVAVGDVFGLGVLEDAS